MFLKKETEYAIHGLLDLVASDEKYIDVEEIADHRRISPTLMAKSFKKMAKAGILDSKLGPNGGFKLKKNPKEITLLEVVEATQEKKFLRCYSGRAPYCPSADCKLKTVVSKMERYLDEYMKNTTLYDLANN